MEPTIPATVDIKEALLELSHSQMHELAKLSGVPFTTLWKVRSGETGNPGIDTVRKFVPFINAAGGKAVQHAD